MMTRRLRFTAGLTTLAVFMLMAVPGATAKVHEETETVTGAIGDTIGDTGATLDDVTIDRMKYDRRTGEMLATGVVEYTTAAGETVTQDFRRVPVGITTGTATSSDMGAMQAHSSCDIINLDLGPIFLDVLGLQVDLSAVELDVIAEPGAGNLLGNLLCSVAGLLDPGSDLGNLLDQVLSGVTRLINQVLRALGGISLA